MAGDHATRWGKTGQLEEENSRYSSPVDGGLYPAGRWTGFPPGQDQVFGRGPEFFRGPTIGSAILFRPVRRQIFLTFVFSFVLVGCVHFS